ncbi:MULTISPECIES: hypothetical protein [Nocardiaceae]|uniref:hypothetical protein n=1 Tax=Nocardiaceae TaxID=85025 RepID=UPI00056A6510|nr:MULTISPECIES: hypothetical protein [Rhodococcus]OZF04108.1 hypothetical protein CH301_06395 [Rhodococcus sp. 15-1189-1-1a]OZF18784.1 hypothetical protein CH299_06940 [Rhodococcus sp. 14-2686-1-2]OZF55200.1 hypothetical protein CH293_06730 [Rhodococcus sp. 14-2470-1b]
MKPSCRSIVVLAAALSLGLAGCSSDEGTDDNAEASGGDLCAQLEDISTFEMNSQTSAQIDPADWPGMQAVLQEYGDGLSEHYDPAIAAADPDIAADLTTVRDASAQVTNLVTEASTFEEYQQKTEATIDVDSFTAARDASARIDTYAQSNCEFAKQMQEQQQQQQPQQPQPQLEEVPAQPGG